MGNLFHKLPPPGSKQVIAQGNYLPAQLPLAIVRLYSQAADAQGIVAEILLA
jgi:hypothetical protein